MLLAVEGPASALDASRSARSGSTAGCKLVCRRDLHCFKRDAARKASLRACELLLRAGKRKSRLVAAAIDQMRPTGVRFPTRVQVSSGNLGLAKVVQPESLRFVKLPVDSLVYDDTRPCDVTQHLDLINLVGFT